MKRLIGVPSCVLVFIERVQNCRFSIRDVARNIFFRVGKSGRGVNHTLCMFVRLYARVKNTKLRKFGRFEPQPPSPPLATPVIDIPTIAQETALLNAWIYQDRHQRNAKRHRDAPGRICKRNAYGVIAIKKESGNALIK